MTNYTTKRKQDPHKPIVGVFWYVVDCSTYKHCKGSDFCPINKKKCVEIAYLSLKLPNKSAKTFLFASSTFLRSGTIYPKVTACP